MMRLGCLGRSAAKPTRGSLIAAAAALALLVVEPASALDLSGTEWERAAQSEELDPYLLFSVALVESAKHQNRFARPWPWALNGPDGSFYGQSREDAERQLAAMLPEELQRTAVGMMQIYVGSHGHRVVEVSDLLEPTVNLMLGASILRESIASSPDDLELGIGRYNAWQNEEAARTYGRRVLGVYQNLKKLSGSYEVSVNSLWNDQ